MLEKVGLCPPFLLRKTISNIEDVKMKRKALSSFIMALGLFIGSAEVSAANFQVITSEGVGVEASTTGVFTANIAGDSIVLQPDFPFQATDRLKIRLSSGAFNDSAYSLEQSLGGAGNGDLTDFQLVRVTSDEIEFRASGVTSGDYILSGSRIAGQPINFLLPVGGVGTEIDISARAFDLGGVYSVFSGLELFQYANQFSANVDTFANGIVDVNEARLQFTDGATDRIALDIRQEALTNGVTLTDGDIIVVTLLGDMSGIDSITAQTDSSGSFTSRGLASIDIGANSATYEFSASDLANGASAILDVAVDNTTPIAARTFTVKADIDFESETDKNLVAVGTAAGAWTINGLQAKVSHLSLNDSGSISWLKVANTGSSRVEIYADIIYSLRDGSEGAVNSAYLGAVDAGGVETISEPTILAAIGDPHTLTDIHLTLTVTGPIDTVHLIAEKKASDGRLSIPAYYDNGSGRSWFR